MNESGNQVGRRVGLTLLLLGVVTVSGFGYWQWLRDETAPALVKTSVAAIIVGTLLLLVSVGVQRMREARDDPYKDVEI